MTEYKLLPRIDGQGVIDMHVHIGPELLRRRYSCMTLAEEARREGVGVVMKNHFQPTTAMAILARKPEDKVAIIGSVTLNYGCGGIDDHGVRSALSGWKSDVTQTDPDRDRFVVWMPTFCAEAHLSVMGRRDIPLHWGVAAKYSREFEEGTGLTLRDTDGKPIPGLLRALKMIAEHDLILASGHLSAEETADLCELAHAAGIARIVLTHPLWYASRLGVETLARLWRDYGAYSELCFVNLSMHGLDDLGIHQYAEVIRAVGPEGVILSSDLGQEFLMTVTEGLKIYFDLLEKEGVHPDEIARMSILNPCRLLFEDIAVPIRSAEIRQDVASATL
jgi:hypothetical protein